MGKTDGANLIYVSEKCLTPFNVECDLLSSARNAAKNLVRLQNESFDFCHKNHMV